MRTHIVIARVDPKEVVVVYAKVPEDFWTSQERLPQSSEGDAEWGVWLPCQGSLTHLSQSLARTPICNTSETPS